MFTTLVKKELRSVLSSPKFAATFLVCTILMLLSVYLGIREFRSAQNQYAAANELVDQEMRESRQWMTMATRIYRQPDPLQIFSAGVQNDIGRYSSITSSEPVKLVHSAYSDDPLFAVFRFIDAAFIMQVIFTLLAIVFTYDAVNGEREGGTLQLIFANGVPKVTYVLAKCAGIWLGLVIPLLLPCLMSIGLLFIFGVPMTASHWARLGGMGGMSLMLFTFFIVYGIFISVSTRRSSVSFLISLVSWVVFVLIVPRIGVMAAGELVRVPTVAEVESRQDEYARDRWNAAMTDMANVWKSREEAMRGMSDAERKKIREDNEWKWTQEDDARRKTVQRDIDDHARVVNEELRNKKNEQERLALTLSRLSPAAVYQIAVMDLSGTDLALKTRYEDAFTAYRKDFNKFKEEKQKETGGIGGLRISFDSNSGLKIDVGREFALSLTGMPVFTMTPTSRGVLHAVAMPFAILSAEIMLVLALAFVTFLRYDVR